MLDTYENRSHLAILLFLAALTAIIGGRGLATGGFAWSDAPLHAMDGVFLHDLAIARPVASVHRWTEEYYLRHQCLGFLVYYPPLFAAIEATVFLLVGISVAAARATVLLMAVATVWLIYLLARDLFSARVGLAAAILSITSPVGTIWSREVMLEWPATFFIVLTLLAYWRHLSKPRWATGTLIALGCLGAYLTKQTAVFVVGVLLVHALLTHQWARPRAHPGTPQTDRLEAGPTRVWGWALRVHPKTLESHRRDAGATWVLGCTVSRRSFLVPMTAAVLLIIGYAAATSGMNRLAPQLILGTPPLRHLLCWSTWLWYDLRVGSILGWPAVVGLVIAIVALAANPGCVRRCSLPLIWLVLWWLICVVLAAKEERYFFYAVPAVAVLIAAGLDQFDAARRFGVGGRVALAVLCGVQVVVAVATPPRRLPTMRPTVDYLARQADADLVLVDSVRDGQFIFDVRTTPGTGDRLIPMRASKFLYSRSARTRYDYQAHVNTPDELRAWLDQYGIHYVVIEDRLPVTNDPSWDTPQRVMLRETLRDYKRFAPVFGQSLSGDDPAWKDVQLVTYRYLDAKPRQTDTIKVSIPAMGREIILPLPPPAGKGI